MICQRPFLREHCQRRRQSSNNSKQASKKTVYLEYQSRRNNLRFEDLLEDNGESWETTEEKVTKVLVSSLFLKSSVPIALVGLLDL